MNNPSNIIKKLISTALCAALILLSPGLPAYQAWAGDQGAKGGPIGGAPLLPTPAIGKGAFGGAGPQVQTGLNLPDVTISPSGLGALPGSEAAVYTHLAPSPFDGRHVLPVNGMGNTGPQRLSASAPDQGGGPVASGEGPKAEGATEKASEPTAWQQTAQPPAAQAATPGPREELSAALKDEKSDRGGALNWFFDKLKRRSSSSSSTSLVAGSDALNPSGLAKGKGSLLKPSSSVPAPASAAAKSSRWQRFKDKFSLAEFNASEKTYLKAESLFYLALTVYLASLPVLVLGITGDAAATGVARGIHYWTMAAGALFAGEIVSRSPMKRVLKLSAMTRAMIFGTIGVTAVAGLLGGAAGWPLFLGLVGLNALVISMHSLVNLKSGGAARVFDSKAKIEKAGYLYSTISSALMLLVPPLLGGLIDFLAKRHGPLVGSGVGYVLVGALMGGVALLYSRVKPLESKGEGSAAQAAPLSASQALKAWFSALMATRHGKVGGLALALGTTLLLASPALGLLATITALFAMVAGAMVMFNWEAMKAIAANTLILGRSGMATFEAFIDDALFAVVLPSFAIDILKAGAVGNGLLLSAITGGGLVASAFMLRKSQILEKRLGAYKWLGLLTAAAALSFIPSFALWGAAGGAGLLIAIPAVFLMKLAVVPLQRRMGTLLQTTISEDPKAEKESDKIWSLMGFFEMLAAGVGGVLFSFLYKHSGPDSAIGQAFGLNAPMKIVTAALAVTSLVYIAGLRMMKGQLTRPTLKVHESGGKEPAALAKLEANLKRMGLPPHETRLEQGAVDELRPTVVVLSPASTYKLAIAQEGARQSPGDVHLALDPSWLTQQVYPDGTTRLLLTKGLTFENGRAVIVEYKTPRRVRYFANFYTLGANDRDDGVPLEQNLDAPQSNSVQLERITNDKLLTRLMLAAKGVAVPATVAFLMAAHPLQGTTSASTTMQVKSMTQDAAAIKSSIAEFLKHYQGEEVVVKPSGPQFHSGRGVRFFARGDVDAMVEHALTLSQDPQMTQDGAVLVDGRLAPPPVYLRTKGEVSGDGAIEALYSVPDGEGRTPARLLSKGELASAAPKEKKDWNIRVLAARAPWGKGVTTGMFARAGAWGVPTTAEAKDPEDNAAMLSIEMLIEALRRQHGLLQSEEEAAQFVADLKKMGADAVDALAANEVKNHARGEGDPRQDQTDFIGLDVMIVLENGRLVPKIIEVNDHDAGGQWQLDIFHPERAGEHSREWIATALERARLDALRGKRIAIVGAGYQGKRFIFERAKELGVEIVLVDKGLPPWKRGLNKVLKPLGLGWKDHWAADLIGEFLSIDTTNHEEALAKARKKLQRSARKNGKIDGIATFWEDDVPLTAELARAFKLPYHTVDAADAVRSKLRTLEKLRAAGVKTGKFARLSSAADLDEAIRTVGFPAVIKPEFGAASMGTVRVNNADELRAAFATIKPQLTPKLDAIFSHGTDMLMMGYLEGREWDYDVPIQNGVVHFDSITDNWPTREPLFVATGSSLPSRQLTKAEQREVAELAAASAHALGLRDGVLHIEGKYTTDGPRIIEVNGRMGGVYVHDWVKAVWGVDLVDQQLLIAAGIPIKPFKPAAPITHLEGEFIIHEESGTLAKQELAEDAKTHPGLHNFRVIKKPGERIEVPYAARTGMIEAKGASSDEARRNLDQLRAKLILDVKKEPQ